MDKFNFISSVSLPLYSQLSIGLEDVQTELKDTQTILQKKEVALAAAEGKVHVLSEELRNKVRVKKEYKWTILLWYIYRR